ncbi:MAG: acetylxylan esterase [Phycisphaerae bacterium]|nr:acetylxylan esterase [Phycisphaerae bacterium]
MTRRLSWVICAAGLGLALATTRAEETTDPGEAADSRPLLHTDTVYTPTEYRHLSTWEARRAWLINQVRFAAGLIPEPKRCPINAHLSGKLVRDGYTLEKVRFESYPGFYVTGNLYRPAEVKGRVPAVANPHGHWGRGRLAHEKLGSIAARCITLARLGAVAFMYDMVGYNDSKQQFEHADHRFAAADCALWGISQFHLQTWNSVRVLDFLQSLPDVDPARIGVTGESGGGTQTFILYSVDERVKVAAPVNMISSTMQGGCICENAPLLRIDANNMEIGALMAPRPLLLISATGDWTKKTPQVEYPFIKSIFELYGRGDLVENVHIDAPHNYNKASREAMYRFFGRRLLNQPDADKITEGEIKIETDKDMLVFADAEPPANMLKGEALIASLKTACRERMEAYQPTSPETLTNLQALVRLGLGQSIGSDWPVVGTVRPKGRSALARIAWERGGRLVWTANEWRDTKTGQEGDAAVIVLPDGLAKIGEHRKLLTEGDHGIFVQPFGTSHMKRTPVTTRAADEGKYYTTFNRSDAAEAVYDILSVIGIETPSQSGTRMKLVGLGRMGPHTLVARAMMPPEVVLRTGVCTAIDMNQMNVDDDQPYINDLFLPGIRKIGGLKAVAAAAAGGGPLWLYNAGEHFNEQWARAAANLGGHELRITREPADDEAIAEWLRHASR